MTYLLTFSISVFLSYFAQKSRGFLKFIALFFAVLLLALVFGLRDSSIGTDTKAYVTTVWNLTKCYSDFNVFFKAILYKNAIEPFYTLWNFVVSRFSSDLNFFLFITGLVMYGIYFIALYNVRKKIVFSFAVYILLFVFFRDSLNTLRQCMAISLCMLGFSFLLKGKYKACIVSSIIAYNFHHSAIIFFIIIGLKKITDVFFLRMESKKIKFFAIIFLAAMLFALSYVLSTFETVGLIDSRYAERYANADTYGTNVPISLFAISIFNLFVFYSVKRKSIDSNMVFFEYLLIIAFIFCFSGLISTFATRMGDYFQICTIFIFPYLYKNYHINKRIKVLHVSFLLFYWFMIVVIANLGNTFPYKSQLLGI